MQHTLEGWRLSVAPAAFSVPLHELAKSIARTHTTCARMHARTQTRACARAHTHMSGRAQRKHADARAALIHTRQHAGSASTHESTLTVGNTQTRINAHTQPQAH
eukprot:3226687-Pleurochrysis_carterae.AAC.2